jgi:hypothetical protein
MLKSNLFVIIMGINKYTIDLIVYDVYQIDYNNHKSQS